MSTPSITRLKFHVPFVATFLAIATLLCVGLLFSPSALAQSDGSGGDSTSHDGEVGDSTDSSTHHNPKPTPCCSCYTVSATIKSDAGDLSYTNESSYSCADCDVDSSEYSTEDGMVTITITLEKNTFSDPEFQAACDKIKPLVRISDGNGSNDSIGLYSLEDFTPVSGSPELSSLEVKLNPLDTPPPYYVNLVCKDLDCPPVRVSASDCLPTSPSLITSSDGPEAPKPVSESECQSCQGGGLGPAFAGLGHGGAQIAVSAGSSLQGDLGASIIMENEDVTANPGPAALRIRGMQGYTFTKDANGALSTLSTDSVSTSIVKTATGEDPDAFEIRRSNKNGDHFATLRVEMKNNKFRVSSTFLGGTKITEFSQTPGSGTIVMTEGLSATDTTGLSKVTRQIMADSSSEKTFSMRVEKFSPTAAAFVTTSNIEYRMLKLPWGYRLAEKTINPGSANTSWVTTWEYYQMGETTGPVASPFNPAPMQANPDAPQHMGPEHMRADGSQRVASQGSYAGAGRLKRMTRPGGYYEDHAYSTNLHIITRPYGASDTETEYREWQPSAKTLSITKRVNGVTLAKREFTRVKTTSYRPMPMLAPTANLATDTISQYRSRVYTGETASGSQYLDTTTTFYPVGSDFGAKVKRVTQADGSYSAHTYQRAAGTKTTTVIKGRYSSADGTSTSTMLNEFGRLVSTETTALGTEQGAVLSRQTVTAHDKLGRPESTSHMDGLYTTSRSYGCCGVDSETDRTGATVSFFYDDLRRVTTRISRASAASEPVSEFISYDGLTTKTTRSSNGLSVFVSEVTRSLDGLLTVSKSPDADYTGPGDTDDTPEITIRTMAYTETGSSITTEYPDGTTSITTSHPDGRTHTSTDQASQLTRYSYGTHNLNGGGSLTRVTPPITSQWTQTYTDFAGRSVKMEYADGSFSSSTYHARGSSPMASVGKLATAIDPDQVQVTYSYNAKGEATVSQPIASSGGQARFRTSTTAQTLVNDDQAGGIGQAYQSISYVNGNQVSRQLRSLNGLVSKSVSHAGASTSTRVDLGDGAWTLTSVTPDGQSSVQSYAKGRLVRTESFDNSSTPVSIACTTYLYDDLGRLTTTTDSRTGATQVTAYLDNGSAIGVSTNNGADSTSHTYDIMGRRLSTTLPDQSVTYTSYTDRGQVLATWGSQTYARLYQYDALGRMRELRTYQNLSHGTVPTVATPGYASTTWHYDSQRGWLVEKNYNGETDDPATTPADADYSYTAAGRLASRTWERGVSTDYSYDQGALETVDYSDSTADVSYTYDSYGRPSTVTQAGNTHSYAYDAATLALLTETVAYDTDADGTADFSRVLTRSQDSLLRPDGLSVSTPPGPGSVTEYAVAYAYDSAGRLNRVHQGSTIPADPEPADFTYAYVANSYGLVETVTGPVHTVTNSYESHRNVLSRKENALPAASTAVSKFDYTVNNLGQRTHLTTSGTAFSTAPVYEWGYNERGELVETNDTSTANNDKAFQYDGIGNRQKTVDGLLASLPASNNYVANALNQYTQANGVNLPVNAYDEDGNLEIAPLPKDPLTNVKYIWDAENRLVKITNTAATSTIAEYAYDYLGRRISKTVEAVTTHYLYDGWNPLIEYAGQTVSKSYTWGMDLSGSMQGAGGVGGLLGVTEHGISSDTDYYPTYDGNGNVSEYLDASGAVQAHYEYDAFGNTLVSSGAKANNFAHRFSTKPNDAETGLYYYGYRYYDPVTGRWPSRDPIEERGGLNVYGFVNNDGINITDRLGLEERVSAEYKGEAYFTAYYKLYQRQPFKQKLIATGQINSDHLATLRGKLSGTYIVDDLGQGIIKKGGRRFQEVFINALGTGTVNSEVWAGIFDSQHAGVGYSISKGDIYAINSRCDMCVTGTITYLVKLTERSMALTPGGGGSFSEKGVSYSVGLSLSLSEGGSLLAQRTNEVSFKICTDGTSEVTENHGKYETYNDFSSTTLARIRASSAVLDRHMDDLNGFGATEIKLGGFEVTFQ